MEILEMKIIIIEIKLLGESDYIQMYPTLEEEISEHEAWLIEIIHCKEINNGENRASENDQKI